MFIDYVTLLLLNMVGGLLVLAAYMSVGKFQEDQRGWAPALALPGVVGLVAGFHMTFTWPLPGPYNIAFGEMTVMLCGLFSAASLAILMRRSLIPVAIYGVVAGAMAIVIGAAFIHAKLSMTPQLAGIGFILTGAAGPAVLLSLLVNRSRLLGLLAAMALLAPAAIWAYIGVKAYWMHLVAGQFAEWAPVIMR